MMSDTLVRVKLKDGNVGGHPIYGPITKTFYGYRKHGEIFRVKPEDAASMTTWEKVASEEVKETKDLPEPVVIQAEGPDLSELTALWGVDAERAAILHEKGFKTAADLADLEDEEQIAELLGVTSTVAKRILSSARK